MKEIELKARVKDRARLEKTLGDIALFSCHVVRDDRYYALEKDSKCKLRIRRESLVSASEKKEKCFVTYKKKEVRLLEDGTSSEVNDERETLIDDACVLEDFLRDAGFCLALEKHKDVKDWTLCIKKESFPREAEIGEDLFAAFELCEVPPLGDFLEIEIVSPFEKPAAVKAVQKKLHELLLLSGLGEDDIENRYYSEMLREALSGS